MRFNQEYFTAFCTLLLLGLFIYCVIYTYRLSGYADFQRDYELQKILIRTLIIQMVSLAVVVLLAILLHPTQIGKNLELLLLPKSSSLELFALGNLLLIVYTLAQIFFLRSNKPRAF